MKQKLKKLMKNKKAVALIALVLVLLICLILIKSVFFPGHGSKYGNRLDGINKIRDLVANEERANILFKPVEIASEATAKAVFEKLNERLSKI